MKINANQLEYLDTILGVPTDVAKHFTFEQAKDIIKKHHEIALSGEDVNVYDLIKAILKALDK